MATIALTFLGAALSFTLTLLLSQWSLGYLENRIPFDMIVSSKLNIVDEVEDVSKIDYREIVKYLSSQSYNLEDYSQVEKYFVYDTELYTKGANDMPPLAMGLSDFNQLRKMLGYKEVSLKKNEFTTQWITTEDNESIEEYIKAHSTLNIAGHKLKISSAPYYKESIGQYIYDSFLGGLIILPDAWCESLTLASKDFYGNTTEKMSFDGAVKLEQEDIPNWFTNNYDNILSKEHQANPLIIRLKVAETNVILNATLGMRILGIYGGTVLLMISLTVLALQQLSDSIEHKGRYNILGKLGIDHKEIGRIIFKQISIYFIIPIVLAVIGFYIFLYTFQSVNSTLIGLYIGDKAFVFNISISLLLIILIYVCYFMATYYTFKRNVDCK